MIDEKKIRQKASDEEVTHFTTSIAVFKDDKLLVAALIATPLICLLLGVLARVLSPHTLNDDGADWDRLYPYFSLTLGLIGSILGSVIGIVMTAILQKSKYRNYVVIGYLLPPSISILYILYIIILNI